MALTTQDNEAWKLKIEKAGKATLATAGKYVDRNIEIEVPEGELQIKSTESSTIDKASSILKTDIGGTLKNKLVTAKEEGKEYLSIGSTASGTAASATVQAKVVVTPTINGFVDTESSQDLTFEVKALTVADVSSTSYYLPVSTLNEEIVTNTKKYIDGKTEEGIIDKIDITITIPEGYHTGSEITTTITDIIPDFTDGTTTALASELLYGTKAYAENGTILIGTMVNHGTLAESGTASAGGTANDGIVSGENVTLSDTNTSGISVTGSGEVTPIVSLSEDGFYKTSTLTGETITSNEETKYITGITIPEGKELSIVNEGTINSLTGSGNITSFDGDITITNISEDSTITIDGKEIIGEDDNGTLPISEVVSDGSSVNVTRGWTNADRTTSIDAGSYSVDCDLTIPEVKYTATLGTGFSEDSFTKDANGYSFTYGGSVTAGKHTATASINTSGFINKGSKSTEEEEIDVYGGNETNTLYLAKAEFERGLSTTYYTGTTIPTSYDVEVSHVGYSETGSVASIQVYDGTIEWAG